MNKLVLNLMLVLLLVLGAGTGVQAGETSPDLEAALDAMGPDEAIAVILTFTDKVNPNNFKNIDNKGQRRSQLVKALKAQSSKNMQAIENVLETPAVGRAFGLWVINGAALTATPYVIGKLAKNPKVESIRLDKKVSAPEPSAAPSAAPEWNLSAIRAPEMWSLGYTGAGTVVATMDTGVDAGHNDLNANWRAGSNSWYDPNGEHPTPYDTDGHGTQVMGILVGGDATGTAIGVAPGAQWIAVKIFNDARKASLSGIHQGFQWLLDPDDNAATDDAPDIVNNSWNLSGDTDPCNIEFQPDIQVLKAAQIAVVFSGGNTGPYSSTSQSPANNPASFAVGATDITDTIDISSSRGPSACDGSVYPEVVAPGINVETADLTFGAFPTASITVSGTSFAAPHVAGSMALLLSAFSDAGAEQLEAALGATAVDLGAPGLDDTYGFGLIDVVAAADWLANTPTPIPTCSDIDNDGYYAEEGCGTELDCVDYDAAINPGACDIKGDGIDQDCDGKDRTKGKACPSDGGDTGGTDPVGSEGKGKTCTDGIDNDGDGSIDCGDSDCSKNKACK